MEKEIYKIISTKGKALVEEKKSKFIAHTKAIETQEQAQQFLEELKKEYWDARHHCYAYVLGDHNEIVKCSDDGEPSQTAGKPILEVLQKSQIHNAIIVVVRYFGGTLLGTGGLVKAYQAAAKEGLLASEIMQLEEGIEVELKISYPYLSKIKYIAEQNNCYVLNTTYEKEVCLDMIVPKEKEQSVKQAMTNQTAGEMNYEIKQKLLYGFDGEKVKKITKKC